MRHYFTILAHEVRTLLYNPGTYIASVLFLLVMGFVFTGILDDYSRAPQETAPAVRFFQVFWIPVLFMVPLLTMKSFAEERRMGTLETLLTTPVSTAEVVFGKFSAAYLFYVVLWGATLGFHYILQVYARDVRYLDSGPLIGGYLFIAVSGLLFVAVGILASALTRSQAVAGILSFTFLLGLIGGLSYISELGTLRQEILSPVRTALEGLRIPGHVDDFTHGIVDTRQVFFYLTGCILALIFSILGVEAKILNS
ncbi:MAG: gliding motility-associated transport system permease protein [Verrucomicrobiota bacterium]|nr:gliding motility-associated transport system permease protein [Verrucomicrobiota bacterium]